MLKIATVRVPEDFLDDLSNFVKEMKLDILHAVTNCAFLKS